MSIDIRERARIDNLLFRVKQTNEKLADACHGDIVTDPQIDALAFAVAAQGEAIQALGQVVLGLAVAK